MQPSEQEVQAARAPPAEATVVEDTGQRPSEPVQEEPEPGLEVMLRVVAREVWLMAFCGPDPWARGFRPLFLQRLCLVSRGCRQAADSLVTSFTINDVKAAIEDTGLPALLLRCRHLHKLTLAQTTWELQPELLELEALLRALPPSSMARIRLLEVQIRPGCPEHGDGWRFDSTLPQAIADTLPQLQVSGAWVCGLMLGARCGNGCEWWLH